MARSNSTALAAHQSSSRYRLPEARRQAILANSDNPAGRISSARLQVIGRQRFKFVQIHDCDGTENTA